MKIKIHNITVHQSHLISIHMQQQWWCSLVYKKERTKKRLAKVLAYNLSQKMKGGLLRLKSFFFYKSDIFFCKSSLFIPLQVLEKPKKMTFHRTTVKRTLQQNRQQVMSLFALSVEPETKFIFAAEWGYFLLLNQGTFDYWGVSPSKLT